MKKKVLIVDDSKTNLYMLETLLREEGLEVISAENGKDALDKAILNPPDLIVADVLMPVMDGYVLCKQWKSDDALRHIPFVIYTATYTGTKNEEFALSLGADRFILKPQEPDVLMNTLREVLDDHYAAKQVAAKPLEEEMQFFKQYNEILFGKLEKKMAELEATNRELRILSERYRLSFENVSDVIYMIDTDLNVLSISPSVERIMGYKPQDFIGRPVTDFANIYTPESFKQAVTDIDLIFKGQTILSTVYEFISKDGTIKIGEVSGSPVMQEGKLIGMIAIARDITDRKRAEDELRESEKQYRDLYDFLPIPAYEMDLEANITYANRAIYEVFRGTDEDVKKGLNAWQRLVPEDVEKSRKNIERLLRGEQVGGTEYALTRLDGSVFPAIVTSRVIYSKGKPVGLRGAIIDITERKGMEDDLRKSEEKYRYLFSNASEAILVIQGGVIKLANPAASMISGYPEEALHLKPFTEFIYPEDREKVYGYYKKRIQGEEVPANYNFRINIKDGSVKWVAIRVALVDWEGSTATLNFLSDITEQKKAEEFLRESEEKYRCLFEYLQDAILLTRPDGSIIEANPAACEMFGRSADELRAVGRNALVDRTDPRLPPALEERARTGIMHAEYTSIRANGEKFLTDVRSTIFNDPSGEQKTSMIIRDITEHRKAEEALRESENRYRAVFEEHSAVKLLIAPDTGIILEANKAAADYYGWSHEQLKQMKIQEISTLPPEGVKKGMDKALTKKQIYFEFRHRRADGSIRDVEVFSGKIEVKGKPFLHAIIHDITDRKRAEENLQKSEARFRSYFELPLIGMAITSPGKGWLEGNDRLSDILGYSWQELKGMTWSELTHPDNLDADVEQFNRIIAGEIDSYMIDKRFIRKDGTAIWTSLAVGCVRKQDGAVDYLVALLDDITDRKESVERLRKSLGATIQAMAVTVETRDPYTAGHQRRVADLARAIATEMCLTADQIDGIRMAAVIHDIGKLAVPAELLSMPRKLTEIEFSLIKTHSRYGHDILKDIEFPWPIARMVLEHHERMDGSGYPQGLTGDGILMESRILSVADVVEAMASHRPYRPTLGLEPALGEISQNRGTRYDPDVVDACLRLFHDKSFKIMD